MYMYRIGSINTYIGGTRDLIGFVVYSCYI